MMYSNKLNTS